MTEFIYFLFFIFFYDRIVFTASNQTVLQSVLSSALEAPVTPKQMCKHTWQ